MESFLNSCSDAANSLVLPRLVQQPAAGRVEPEASNSVHVESTKLLGYEWWTSFAWELCPPTVI